jgi:hypothetical protein
VHEVADLMARGRIHRVLVVRDGKPTGIVPRSIWCECCATCFASSRSRPDA